MLNRNPGWIYNILDLIVRVAILLTMLITKWMNYFNAIYPLDPNRNYILEGNFCGFFFFFSALKISINKENEITIPVGDFNSFFN